LRREEKRREEKRREEKRREEKRREEKRREESHQPEPVISLPHSGIDENGFLSKRQNILQILEAERSRSAAGIKPPHS
jgi:hypothetical protein